MITDIIIYCEFKIFLITDITIYCEFKILFNLLIP